MNLSDQVIKYLKKRDKSGILIMDQDALPCERISTQNISLDRILGGGMPLGKIVEIFGDEGSGKTTLSLHLLAEAQKRGGLGCVVDTEHALDLEYAESLGIDVSSLIVGQPDSGEEAFSLALEVMKGKQAIDDGQQTKKKTYEKPPLVIVVDSAAALVPLEEVRAEIEDYKISPVAKLMSQSLRRIAGPVALSNCLLVFTNQLRDKINTMYASRGTISYSTGGRALKFYASVRLSLRTGTKIKIGDEVIGQNVRASAVKNKTASPFQDTEFRITYGKGIDKIFSLVTEGLEHGYIEKKGSWYQYKDELKFQGLEMFMDQLRLDSALIETIDKEIRDGNS